MFSSQVQNGTKGLEILTPSGTGAANSKLVKFMGSSITREYERDIKGYNYVMNTPSSSTWIACPASNKHSLAITQPLLVLQLATFEEANFHLEIVVMDHTDRKRRIHIATAYRRFETNGLHAQVPWYVGDVEEGRWTQVVFDLNFLTEKCFEAGFTSLDSFVIKPSVTVRNIFSVPMSARQGGSVVSSVAVPKSLHFPPGVSYDTKFFDESIEYALITPPQKEQAVTKKATKKAGAEGGGLGVTGVTVKRNKRAAGDKKDDKKGVRKSQDLSTTTPLKPAVSVTANRRAQTAANIAKRKAEENAAKDKEHAKHRKEVASVESPSRAAVKAKVAQMKKESIGKKVPVVQARSPAKAKKGTTAQSQSVYESLEHPALPPPKMKSPQKRASRPVPITVRTVPVPATKPVGWGGGMEFSDSGDESIQGSQEEEEEEELLMVEPRAAPGGKNPWGGFKLARVTTPPALEARRSPFRDSDDLGAPTVFTGMKMGTGGAGRGDELLAELENKLEIATLTLTEAEREYIMEFGELPEEI